MKLTEATIARLRLTIKRQSLGNFALILITSLELSSAASSREVVTNTLDALSKKCGQSQIAPISPEISLRLSEDAANKGETDRAENFVLAGLCAFKDDIGTAFQFREFTASAIERLLEADDSELALQILGLTQFKEALLEANETADLIHLRMAAARGLSYANENTQALRLRQQLQKAIERHFGVDSNESIENQTRIANLLIERGDVSKGVDQLNELFESNNSRPHLKRRVLVTLIESAAIALALSGNETGAIERLRVAKSISDDESRRVTVRELDLDEEIASILLRSERYDDALATQSNVFLQRQRYFPSLSARLTRCLWRLGFIYLSLQRTDTAEAIFIALRAKLQENPSPSSKLLELETASRLANIDAKRGRFNEAAEKWRLSYQSEMMLLGPEAPDTLIEETNYANALSHVGEASIACAKLQDALKRQQSSHPDDLWVNEFTRISLARCLLLDGPSQDLGQARNLLLDARTNLARGNRQSGIHALYAIASIAKVDLKLNLRDEAKLMLETLLAQTESARSENSIGMASRDSAFFTWIDGLMVNGEDVLGYRELALLHAQDHELEQALRVSELARDRTLGDRFAEQAWLRDSVPPAERAQLEPVLAQIQDLDERLAVAPDLMERVRLESQRTMAVAQRGRMERELRERLHLAGPDSPPPRLDALREHLAAGTVLVSVMHSGENWWALLIGRDAPVRYVALPDPDLGRNAAAWVRRLRGEPVRAWPLPQGRLSIDDLRPPGTTGRFLTTAQLGDRLSAGLLAPLAPALGDARHIVFVGDDELVGVPLQALPLGEGLAVDRYDISYAPSLTTYARWQGRPPARHVRDLLAVGAIDYPHRAAAGVDDPVAIGLEFAADHPLAQAGGEISAIARLFPAQRRRLMTGASARKSLLRTASVSGELAGYRYVHLATHAWADAERPEASAVVLASDGSEPPLQVVMTAAELAGLRMDADLIVLSACDTGSGHFEHGRGLLGLAYAALAAGNRAAVLSLWSIDDATTAPFMVRFYERLVEGLGPAAALAATQREFRRSADPGRSDPAAWAPFLVYGAY